MTLPLPPSPLPHDLSCSRLPAYSRSGSLPVASLALSSHHSLFFFPSNDLFVYMKHAGQTLKCHLRFPFVLSYFIDKQQVNQWQLVAGTWSPLGSPGRAVATLKGWRNMSGFIVDQSSCLHFLSSKYSAGNNYSKTGKQENIWLMYAVYFCSIPHTKHNRYCCLVSVDCNRYTASQECRHHRCSVSPHVQTSIAQTVHQESAAAEVEIHPLTEREREE